MPELYALQILSQAHIANINTYRKSVRGCKPKTSKHALDKLKNFNWYITYLNILLFTCSLARMICRFVQVFGPCMHAMPILFLLLLLLFLRIHFDFSIYQGAHILFDYGNWVVIYIHQVGITICEIRALVCNVCNANLWIIQPTCLLHSKHIEPMLQRLYKNLLLYTPAQPKLFVYFLVSA